MPWHRQVHANAGGGGSRPQRSSNARPPARSSRCRAAARPRADGSGPTAPGSSSTRWRSTTRPSSEASSASRRSRPSGRSTACAPAGRSQSPPSSARKPRSASTRRLLGACSIADEVRRGDPVVVAALDRERPLRDLRQEHRLVEDLGDVAGEPEPFERHRRHDDGVEVGGPFQPGGHVAAQPAEREVGTEVDELHAPARRSRADAGTGRQVGQAAAHQRVAGVATLGDRGQHEARHGGRRQVLARVHREVGAPVEDGGLHLLGEHALAAQLPDGDVEPPVGDHLHHHELHGEAGLGGLQQRGHVLGLPACERAATRGDAEWSGPSRHADADPSVSRVRGRTSRAARRPDARHGPCRPGP